MQVRDVGRRRFERENIFDYEVTKVNAKTVKIDYGRAEFKRVWPIRRHMVIAKFELGSIDELHYLEYVD